jgi:hypothetical protein
MQRKEAGMLILMQLYLGIACFSLMAEVVPNKIKVGFVSAQLDDPAACSDCSMSRLPE